MSVIPCEQNADLRNQIERFSEVLKTQAHLLGSHGLDEKDFYNSGLFRGAIERIRGQFIATMRPKREFAQHILNHLEDTGKIASWESAEADSRNDYWVTLKSGKRACIGLTGALDGNNATLFERPSDADEFVIWSVSTNAGTDPRRNVWSGIHTRLGAEIISTGKHVDGLIVWDMVCGTTGRACPKVTGSMDQRRLTDVGPFRLPPSCIYVFPSQRNGETGNAAPPLAVSGIELLTAFNECFEGRDDEINYVSFDIESRGGETWRKTTISRGGKVQKESDLVPIRRG